MIIMDNETIESLLHRLKIDDSIDAFKQQDIDLDLLLEISEEDLKETSSRNKTKTDDWKADENYLGNKTN